MGERERIHIQNTKSNHQPRKPFNMTDNLRQGAGDKLASNLKPDSEKSTLEKGQDQVKGTADSLAGQAQPEDQKSYTQQATDAISNAGQQVSDTLGLSGGKK